MKIRYYTAKWCSPCRSFGPVVDRVAKKLNVTVEKIDIDEVPFDQIEKMNISSVPVLVLDTDEKDDTMRFVGAVTEGFLTETLTQLLDK